MLELKDGGKYVNRLGDVVTVGYRRSGLRYPFNAINSIRTYNEHGFVYDESAPDNLDLVAEYKEPEDSVSKAALAEYIRNRLAVLAVLTESDDIYMGYASEHSMGTLLALCDEFGIVL